VESAYREGSLEEAELLGRVEKELPLTPCRWEEEERPLSFLYMLRGRRHGEEKLCGDGGEVAPAGPQR
jgi:hypothetical protein